MENKIASSIFVVVDMLLQEITHSWFKVCVKDSQGLSNLHNPITVNYVVVGGITFILNIYLKLLSLRPATTYIDTLRRGTGLGNTGEIRALMNNSELWRAAIRDSRGGVG